MREFAKVTMPVIAAVAILVLGTATVSMAGVPPVPEIDSTTGMAAAALVASAVLIIRGRRRK
jgi:hypothetical protein